MPTFLIPVPNVIVFQYNPETHDAHLERSRRRQSRSGTENGNPLAVKGMPGESFSFTICHGRQRRASPDGSAVAAAIAQVSGVYSAAGGAGDAALPGRLRRFGLLGAVSAAAAGQALSDASSDADQRNVRYRPQPRACGALRLGSGRIVPVRVTGLTITEKLYDGTLNPTHAEAQLALEC